MANAMFTSVLEQTKFIGLLKSLGGRDSVVLKLFLFEASMVGLAGGVVGVLLSFLGSELLGTFGLPSKITIELVLLGLGFSLIVGMSADQRRLVFLTNRRDRMSPVGMTLVLVNTLPVFPIL